MAMNGGKIEFGIGYKVDQSGLKSVESQLRNLSHMLPQDFLKIHPELGDVKTAEKKLQELTSAAKELREVYSSAFDDKTGLYNIEKIKTSLKGMDIGAMYNKMAQFGEAGLTAFRQMTDQVSQVNLRFRETNGFLDKMGETLVNTVKWSIASSAVNKFTGAVQQAWGYVQHLDTSLNDIRIVTGKSADEMDKFAIKANDAAKALGSSTTEYTEAALIYYQQGLSDEESQARAETTLKAANVTGQTGQQVSEELTAVWNGYKVTAEETELYVDKLAAVAASTASDLEELSTGMSKVASAANNMGVDVDQLNAQLATIISVTRQAPETAGTALKTIFARIEDLKLGGTDEDGVKLGQVSSGLESMGIEIKDAQGNLRDLGEVIEEIGGKWDTWTESQKSAIAQLVAGKRQYNNLLALFDNWDMYNDALETSRNSVGTLQEQQDIYMESTEAHLQQLSTQWEDMYDSILDTDTINDALDGFTGILNIFTNIVDGLGGGKTLLLGLVAAISSIKPIASAITKEISNIMINSQNAKLNAGEWSDYISSVRANLAETMPLYAEREALLKKMEEQSHLMTLEEKQQTVEEIKRLERLSDEVKLGKQKLEDQKAYIQETAKIMANTGSADETKTQAEKINNNENFTNDREGRKAATDVLEAQATNIDEAEGKLKEYIKGIKEVKEEFNKAIEASNDNDIIDPETEKKLIQQADKLKASKEELKELLKTAGPGAKEDIEALIKKIDEVPESLKGITGIQDDIDAFFEDIEESGADAFNRAKEANQQAMDSIVAAEKAAAQEAAEAAAAAEEKRLAKIRERAQAITDLTSGISSMAFGLSSLSNLPNIISDNNLSAFEKFVQLTTSLTMGLPMVVNGFKNLSTGLQTLTGTTTLADAAQKIFNGDLALGAKLSEFFKAKLDGLKTGFSTLWKVMKAHPIVALITGFVALTKVIVGITNEINKVRAAANAASTEQQVTISQQDLDRAKEYSETVQEVVESYKSLKEEYSNNLPKLRTEVYDIIKAHNLQVDAVEILTASYEELDDIIHKIESDTTSAQNVAEKNLIDAKRNNLAAQAEKYTSENKTFWKDTVGGTFTGSNENMSYAVDEAAGVTDLMAFNGNMDWAAFYALTKEQQDSVIAVLESYEWINSRASDALNAIRQNQSEMDALRIEEESYNKSITNEIYQKLTSDKEIKTVEDFNNIKDQLVENLTTELGVTKDEALKLVEEELNQQENLININAGIELSEQLKGTKLGEQKDLAEQIAKLSQSDLSFLTDNLDLASTYESLDEFFERYKDLQKALQKKNNALTITTVFKNAKNGSFKEEDIDNLFSEQQFVEGFGKTKEEFTAEPFELQTADLVAYYVTADHEEREYQKLKEEGNKKDREEERAGYEEKLKQVEELKQKLQEYYKVSDNAFEENYISNAKDVLQNAYEGGDKKAAEVSTSSYNSEIGITSTEAKEVLGTGEQVLDKYAAGVEKLTKAEEFMLKSMEESTGKTRDQLVELKQSTVAYESFTRATRNLGISEKSLSAINESLGGTISDLDNQIKNSDDILNKSAEEWNDFGEGLENMQKFTSTGIDNLQNAFSSLTSIIKDYNSEGTISIDNLQTILSMDTAYLSALQIQNGQMSLNYDTLKQIALARLDEAEAEAYAQFIKELNNETDKEAYDLTQEGITATRDYGTTAVEAANKAKASKTDWEEYWQAALHSKDKTIKPSDQAAADAYYNKIQAINQVREQIINGDFSKTLEKTSSSTSKSTKDTAEYLEREVDLYREINDELDDIESTLGRIQKINDHSWGLSAKKSLEKENALLVKQNELLEKKKATAESDLSTRRKQLEDQGVTFSDDGSTMTNAEQRLTALYNEYNAMVDKYNAMSKDEQNSYKTTLESKKNTIEAIEKAMDDYESAYNDYNGVLDDLLDSHYELIENAVNQFNADIDVRLELDEARENWEDFWAEVMEDLEDDDFVGKFNQNFRKLDIYTGVTSGADNSQIADLTKHVSDTTSEVNKQIASAANGGEDSVFKDDSNLSKETLTNYVNQLQDAVKNAKAEIDTMMENYLSELDSAQTKIDEQVDGWNRIGDHIEHNMEMIKLLYGEKAYEDLDAQFEQQYENNLELVETQKMSMDYWQNKVAEEEALMNSYEKGSAQYKMYEKAYQEASKNYKDAVADLDKTVEDSIKSLQEWRQNQVDAITDTLDKALSGGMGIENMEKQWDLVLEMQNTYLDNVERAMEMEGLQNEFDKVLNDMDLRGEKQQEFLKFMDEENAKLKEKNKLTQYDIDEVKARLEIKKAEMALEEAQRNKSNMRLRRDTQGNYTYQYTANEGAVEEAENQVLTAKKEWYELVKKRNIDLTKDVIDIRKRMVEEEKNIAAAEAANDEVAKQAALERYNLLAEQEKALMGEAEKAKQDMFDGTAVYFQDVEDNTVLPMWDTMIQNMVDKWSAGGEESFVGSVKTAIKDLENVQESFKTKTEDILKTAGLSYDSFKKDHIDNAKKGLEDLQGSNEDLQLALDDTDNNLKNMNTTLDEAVKGYNELKDAAVNAIAEANKALEELAKTAIETAKEVETAVKAAESAPSLEKSASNKTEQKSNDSNYEAPAAEDTTERFEIYTDPQGVSGRNYYARDLSNGDIINGTYMKDKDTITEILKKKGWHSSQGRWQGWAQNKIWSFDTGGYTGEWNNNGRLAVLHQKELVLNEADTSNLLKAVSLIRTLVGVANSADFNRIASSVVGAGSTSAQLANSVNSGALQSIASNVTNNSNVSNTKDVTINADFSGVRSADEIYKALTELQNYNLQSLYA